MLYGFILRHHNSIITQQSTLQAETEAACRFELSNKVGI